MRKSLIITVVIALLCLCGCEAVVTVPESPEPTRANEMLLTTTAAEESIDKLEATTTSSVEIDVPEKNEEESGTPTEDVVSTDNEAYLAEKNDPVSSESTVPSFEEVKADKPSEQTETQLPAPSEPTKETEQYKPTEQPAATEPDEAPAEPPAPTETPATTEPHVPVETEQPVETEPKTAYDYEFDINAIRADCIAIGQGMGYTLNTSLSPQNATWWNPVEQPEPEAKQIALSLELYTTGSLDIFGKQSNVDLDKRIVVFDIHGLGSQLKPTGLLVITDTMLNRVTLNWKKGKRTHVFIDEFHVVFENEFSAQFFNSAWRQFRKRNAYPTAITQNVEYLLDSVQASTMLSNSEFVIMLNQAASDREKLARLLNISNEQMSYITNADAGCGLIKYGSALVPFINQFPHDTKLYQLMTTRPGEGEFARGQD